MNADAFQRGYEFARKAPAARPVEDAPDWEVRVCSSCGIEVGFGHDDGCQHAPPVPVEDGPECKKCWDSGVVSVSYGGLGGSVDCECRHAAPVEDGEREAGFVYSPDEAEKVRGLLADPQGLPAQGVPLATAADQDGEREAAFKDAVAREEVSTERALRNGKWDDPVSMLVSRVGSALNQMAQKPDVLPATRVKLEAALAVFKDTYGVFPVPPAADQDAPSETPDRLASGDESQGGLPAAERDIVALLKNRVGELGDEVLSLNRDVVRLRRERDTARELLAAAPPVADQDELRERIAAILTGAGDNDGPPEWRARNRERRLALADEILAVLPSVRDEGRRYRQERDEAIKHLQRVCAIDAGYDREVVSPTLLRRIRRASRFLSRVVAEGNEGKR